MKHLGVVAVLAILLSACTTFHPIGAPTGSLVGDAGPAVGVPAVAPMPDFVLADLENAQAIFKAAGDQVGVNCFGEIIAHRLDLVNLNAAAPVTGVFSAFAAARVKGNVIRRGIPESVHVACAPLVIDAQTVLLRLHQ